MNIRSKLMGAAALGAAAMLLPSISNAGVLTAGTGSGNAGGNVVIPMSFTGDGSTVDFTGRVSFDGTKFTATVSNQNGGQCSINNPGLVTANILVTPPAGMTTPIVTGPTTYCNVTFAIGAAVPAGVNTLTAAMSPLPLGCSDNLGNPVACTSTNGSITVTVLSPEFTSTPAVGPRTINTFFSTAQTDVITVDNNAGDVGGPNLTVAAAITSVVGTSGTITVSPANAGAGIPQTGPAVAFTVTCTGSAATSGATTANLVFTTNDAKDGVNETTVTYPYTCNVSNAPTPQLTAAPSPITLTANVGSSSNQVLTISETGTANLVVGAQSGLSGVLSVNSTAGFTINDGGAAVTRTITCTPTSAALVSQTFTIPSNDPTSPKLVPVSCQGVAPVYSSTPAAGSTITINTTPGVAGTAPLTVNNTGTGSLSVNAATGLSGVLSIAPATAQTIAPAGNVAYTLSCNSPDAGTFTQTLSFVHNAPGTPATYTVTCVVTGPEFSSAPPSGGSLALSAFPGQTGNGNIVVTNLGNAALTLSACTASAGFTVVAPASIAAGGTGNIAVSAVAPSSPGQIATGTLTCTTNDNNEGTVTYNLSITALNSSIPSLNLIGKLLLALTLLGLAGFALRSRAV